MPAMECRSRGWFCRLTMKGSRKSMMQQFILVGGGFLTCHVLEKEGGGDNDSMGGELDYLANDSVKCNSWSKRPQHSNQHQPKERKRCRNWSSDESSRFSWQQVRFMAFLARSSPILVSSTYTESKIKLIELEWKCRYISNLISSLSKCVDYISIIFSIQMCKLSHRYMMWWMMNV